MNLLEFTKNNLLILDGAMGTMLQRGFSVAEVHRAYLEAGANMILTNTFADNSNENIAEMVAVAKSAATEFGAFVGLDVAPTGEMFEPIGTLGFDEAYAGYKRQVLTGVQAGVDAIYIETMTDLAEAKCAVQAARENCDLPIFCTMSFEANMRTFMGVEISAFATEITKIGADFVGINCSVGPREMVEMAKELKRHTDLPIIIKPNAGLPEIENGEIVYNVTPEEFAAEMKAVTAIGVAGIGGCCGTTPEFIKQLTNN